MALQGMLQVTLQVMLHFSNLGCWSAKKAKRTWSVEAPLEALQQSEVASLFPSLAVSDQIGVCYHIVNIWSGTVKVEAASPMLHFAEATAEAWLEVYPEAP